jgi:hypothetical protein
MDNEPKVTTGERGEIIIYQAAQGQPDLQVRLAQDSLWLSLNQIAALFERDKSVISRHLRNVYATAELDRMATVAFFATVQNEGGRVVERQVEYFNLDAILSVGYRVNSKRGTQFRRRRGRLSRPRGESRAPALLPGEESQLRGWQQAHWGGAVPLVHGEKRHPVSAGRGQADRGQRARRHHPDDR